MLSTNWAEIALYFYYNLVAFNFVDNYLITISYDYHFVFHH